VFQPNIIPVCVPETDEDFIGRTAYVTGNRVLWKFHENFYQKFVVYFPTYTKYV
jgi:hypothetical protein